jgi:septal ring-binding cell division protein DamX
LRRLAVRALVALGFAAVIGGIVYFTYIRPTTRPGDEEEARLLAALLQEARVGEEADGEETGGVEVREEAGQTGAVKPKTPVQTRPPAAATPAPSRQPAIAPPQGVAPAPALAKTSLSTMLSSDANFRSALGLVGERRFPEAADSFRRALESQASGAYSIQILLACQDATLENSFARAAGRTLYAVPTTFRGQACYRLFDGLYGSEEEARRELERLPELFFEGGNRPVVVRTPRP